MKSQLKEYLKVSHMGDGDYRVISWHTMLPEESWASLRAISAAEIVRLQKLGIEIIEVPS